MRTILSICAAILTAGIATAEPVKPRVTHVSPDGTVNEKHTDGVYRAIPGEPKRKAATAAPVPGGSVVPTVTLPQGGCPGGVCPVPAQPRRGFLRW